MIMAGKVMIDTKRLTKPGHQVDIDSDIQVEDSPKYVSRGGDKLDSVAGQLNLDFDSKVVLDVGSSTGGFTDYALRHGATKVYAVDVGTAQLDYKLRQDARVVVMEQTDIRDVSPEQLDPRPDLAVIDVSFISLTKVLPKVAELIKPGVQILAMAKPQFETDKATADKYKGIIKDPVLRDKILAEFEQKIAPDFAIIAKCDSGVTGAKGNLERFYLLKPQQPIH